MTGKKPLDEIIVIAILKESNVLRFINFKKTNKKIVRIEYNIKILKDCLNISCEKAIDINLPSQQSKLVINGSLISNKYWDGYYCPGCE